MGGVVERETNSAFQQTGDLRPVSPLSLEQLLSRPQSHRLVNPVMAYCAEQYLQLGSHRRFHVRSVRNDLPDRRPINANLRV